jgi:N-acetylmuramoyl-L-alanine amidase
VSGQNLYYPWDQIARDAGLTVMVTGTNSGWERRARSSGGFPVPPLGVVWHHAASSTSTSDEACVNYQVRGNPDNPVGNMTLGRDGSVWPIAGGASNCAGKGGPMNFSRGQCPKDQGNTYLVNIEVNNNGVGEPWSEQLIDAYFRLSNAINAYLGNQPTDITSHALGTGDGYTNRKVDPATNDAVQGLWVPRSANSSKTWVLADMRSECANRAAGGGPTPVPPDPVPPDPTPPQPPVTNWPASLTSSLPSIAKGSGNYWMVKRMQHLLAAHGYMNEANVNNYDGVWGNGTDNAKRNFDNDHGLAGPDTDCGPKSWAALCGSMPNLSVGASGFDVKIMQHLLACCGFMNEANTANYDGAWGSGTDKAKVNFDNAAGLTPSPPTDCGQKSWTALMTS